MKRLAALREVNRPLIFFGLVAMGIRRPAKVLLCADRVALMTWSADTVDSALSLCAKRRSST